jgi:hypothetical protein
MAFQRHDWRAERVAWAAMALIVVAALLGLFSSGPLSTARKGGSADELEVSYSRFMRLSAPEYMTVRLRRKAGSEDGFALLLDDRFIAAFRIVQVTPPPARSFAAGEGLRMEFASSGADHAAITLHLEPLRSGWMSPQVALPGGPGFQLPMIVYP